jgi:L-fucose isomerase-like protein
MNNIAAVKTGIVAVSRDCFPLDLSHSRREAVVKECRKKKIPVTELETIIENEAGVLKALEEIKAKQINALVIYLGNFGPEGPIAMLAQRFNGPVMVCGAAEETQTNLINGRGDAYCGMLSASYNLHLREVSAYIPDNPVGTATETAESISQFIPVARVILSVTRLKIFAFGPRPQDFLTCHAPIKPLFDIGVEIMENSELDLYDIFLKAKDDPMTKKIQKQIKQELGGNIDSTLLTKLAQYETALTKFFETNLGASEFGIFANKCWPAFEPYFGFVPCYINSRLTGKGIPVACEVDIYGALSEYIAMAATEAPSTLLDINNTVPADMIKAAKSKMKTYAPSDLFMAFHCGNTPGSCLTSCNLQYHIIMHRLLEGDKPPLITHGTLEGQIKPGKVTVFRVQPFFADELKAYIAQGEVLDINPRSFGGTGVFAIKEMQRFYRNVLLEKGFPHHAAIAFGSVGKTVHSALKMFGIEDIAYNQPKNILYPGENPFD